MKTVEFIKAEIFILPKLAFKYQGSASQELGLDGELIENLVNIWESLPKNTKQGEFGDQIWIQVCFVTPNQTDNISNWYEKTIDGYAELEGWKPKSCYLPRALFENKKEGDCITINLPIIKEYSPKDIEELSEKEDVYIYASTTIKVQLQLSQTKHKYSHYGNFEEVLNKF